MDYELEISPAGRQENDARYTVRRCQRYADFSGSSPEVSKRELEKGTCKLVRLQDPPNAHRMQQQIKLAQKPLMKS